MAKPVIIAEEIEKKLMKLVARQKNLREIEEKSFKEIHELKKIHEEQKETIQKLEEKIKTLRIAKSLEKKEGAEEAKKRINELVREIDKCLGLLSV